MAVVRVRPVDTAAPRLPPGVMSPEGGLQSDESFAEHFSWHQTSHCLQLQAINEWVKESDSWKWTVLSQAHWKNMPVATFLQIDIMLHLARLQTLLKRLRTCLVLSETDECESGTVLFHWLLYVSLQFRNQMSR